jgi:hypothetical protein
MRKRRPVKEDRPNPGVPEPGAVDTRAIRDYNLAC